MTEQKFLSTYQATLTYRSPDGKKQEFSVEVEAYSREEAWQKAFNKMYQDKQDTIHEAMEKHRKIPIYGPKSSK